MTRARRRLPASIVVRSTGWRPVAFWCIVAIAVIGIVCARPVREPADDDRSRYHDRSFEVVHVVDGDTFDIAAPDGAKDVTRIRLWGVDTPETARGGEPAMHFADEAKAFAARTLAGRRVHVVLAPGRTRGKYGRLLAYVFLERGGRMFNELLLEGGYAYADVRFPHPYDERFRQIERRAERSGVGLWAGVTPDKMPAWKRRGEKD
jgi:micrococcal nuclease